MLLVACSDPRPPGSDAMVDAVSDTMVDTANDTANDTASDTSSDAPARDANDVNDGSALDVSTFDSGLGTTPGAGDLVVVEIQGNPVTATDEEAEFIELSNVSGRPLDLAGVTLAHVAYPAGEPTASTATHTIVGSVPVAAGGRVLLARSSGGFFGDATIGYVYDGFVFGNGMETNRLRVLAPGWDGAEPVAAADLVDEVKTEVGIFDNALRGRAWALDPAAVPTPSASLNDDVGNWCSASGSGVEYRANNFGTPGAPNACN